MPDQAPPKTPSREELAHSPIDLNSPRETRIAQAKAWCETYPSETIPSVAILYGLNPNTLKSSIRRDTPSNTHRQGGLNRVLNSAQEKAVHSFIRSLLLHQILPTHDLVYNAICNLVTSQTNQFTNIKKKAPSHSWFRAWYHKAGLHTITTKPIASIRITAAKIEEVEHWFEGYSTTIQRYNIERGDIWNFDEAGFRVGCTKGQKVMVPVDIREVASCI
jgi:hypothetical protein